MKPAVAIRFLLFLLSAVPVPDGRAQGLFSSGHWYKFSVEREGVYKISYDVLRKTGINPATIDPRNLRLYSNRGGMLPQAISADRNGYPEELSVFVSGEDDGKFDKSDFILFYASGPADATLLPQTGIFSFRNNLYSDKNFIFLTVSDQPGKRITTVPGLAMEAPVIDQFNDYLYHEKDERNELHSGREWYGEKFGPDLELTLSFEVPGIVSGSDIKIVSDVMGQSYGQAAFRIFINNVQAAEQTILPITNGRYAMKGYDRRDTIAVNESAFGSASVNEQRIRYQFMKATGFSQGYLDFVLLNFVRHLRLYGDQTIFSSAASLASEFSTFRIADVNDQTTIWDITDQFNIRNQEFTLSGNTGSFVVETGDLRKFVAFNTKIATPVFAGQVNNQDLRSQSTPNLVIITHPLFKSEAERLASHRRQTGWTVLVETAERIYHEFSSGRQDVTAIRDFIKVLYDKDPDALNAVLLFGKSSYDYKDRIADNTNFVPTYESRNSLHPLQTFSSDDYFGFLEVTEGEWQESPSRSHTLDVGVGRLPVATIEEAAVVVGKIVRYDDNAQSSGYWRKRIVFVADDGNSDDGFTSLHQSQADELTRLIDTTGPAFDIRKMYMGTYPKTIKPNGESVPKMTEDIIRAFEDGSLIINFTGHGSEKVWTDEMILTDRIIASLRNKTYPFLVTATCEFGRHDDPQQTSSAELAITMKEGGAIGMVTTARPVNATTNFDLNQAFYEALLQRAGNGFKCIGEVFRETKNNSISGVSNRNFSLLADPSMTLALPEQLIRITSVKTANASDTLKALSTVIIKGQIENPDGALLTNFDGTAEIALFNKETDFATTGRTNPVFRFKEWNNVLFRGEATVTNGEFDLAFMLPKNISYAMGKGKLSAYARDVNGNDANGFSEDFMIGGTELNVISESSPPKIDLFVGDTTFVNGGITTPDTYLIALLSDESGVNISNYGIGNSLIAVLDDNAATYVLNDHYLAAADHSEKGMIRYPLNDLSPGRHRITLKAWDIFNNGSQSTIDFVVTDGEQIVIETIGNYPNPFVGQTTIFFTHNRSGDDLEAQLFIYSPAGNMIKSIEIPVSQGEYKIDLLELDNGVNEPKKLPAGLYLARLVIRSLTNGSKSEQVTKLIILN